MLLLEGGKDTVDDGLPGHLNDSSPRETQGEGICYSSGISSSSQKLEGSVEYTGCHEGNSFPTRGEPMRTNGEVGRRGFDGRFYRS